MFWSAALHAAYSCFDRVLSALDHFSFYVLSNFIIHEKMVKINNLIMWRQQEEGGTEGQVSCPTKIFLIKKWCMLYGEKFPQGYFLSCGGRGDKVPCPYDCHSFFVKCLNLNHRNQFILLFNQRLSIHSNFICPIGAVSSCIWVTALVDLIHVISER